MTEPSEGNMTEASDFEIVSTRQRRIAELARIMAICGSFSSVGYVTGCWFD